MNEFNEGSISPEAKKVEKKELPKELKILVVEDQEYPVIGVLRAIKKNLGELLPEFRDGGNLKWVDNMRDLRKTIEDPSLVFDIVFLDNRILARPLDESIVREPSRNTDFLEMAGVEDGSFAIYDDSDEFMDAEKVPAYPLIGELKAKGMLVIGTSSMSDGELRSFGGEKPDFKMSKTIGDADDDLAKMKDEVLEKLTEEKK